jgi:hypothetical protein
MSKAQTPGTTLTAELRHYFHIGSSTRHYRKSRLGNRQDLHNEMVEAIESAAAYAGYFHQPMQDALTNAGPVACSYRKHVGGYRLNGNIIAAINSLSPWQFAAFLGQMVDAGISNVGEGEQFLNGWVA